MAQKYNIYINQKSLFIGNSIPKGLSDYQLVDVEAFDFLTFYKSILKSKVDVYFMQTDDVKQAYKTVKSTLKIIEAAGGFVQNEDEKYLFIKRNGKWDLPKGKLEVGEKKKDAAVREVEEECGITIKKIGKKLCKTYHVYELKGKLVLKVSHWYKMEAKANQKLVPQLEEGITEVKWFTKKDWSIVRANTYPSILDVLDCYMS